MHFPLHLIANGITMLFSISVFIKLGLLNENALVVIKPLKNGSFSRTLADCNPSRRNSLLPIIPILSSFLHELLLGVRTNLVAYRIAHDLISHTLRLCYSVDTSKY